MGVEGNMEGLSQCGRSRKRWQGGIHIPYFLLLDGAVVLLRQPWQILFDAANLLGYLHLRVMWFKIRRFHEFT
jgi:hypothetical protein